MQQVITNEDSKFGLSELSKQLRILQSTNETQKATIESLERKVKILTDLKGVSTDSIKVALYEACQNESHSELLSEISKLQSELDIFKTQFHGDTFYRNKDSQETAVLELRVGELEEIETNLRLQVDDIYQKLIESTSNVSKYESENQILKLEFQKSETIMQKEINDLKSARDSLRHEIKQADSSYQMEITTLESERDSLKKEIYELESKKHYTISAPKGSSHGLSDKLNGSKDSILLDKTNKKIGSTDEEIYLKANKQIIFLETQLQSTHTKLLKKDNALKYQEMKFQESLLKEKNKNLQSQSQLEAQTLESVRILEKQKAGNKLLKSKINLLKDRYDALDLASQLRKDQFTARFQLQNDRIFDMEQQLMSLYAAFDILQKDQTVESIRKNMPSLINDSNSQLTFKSDNITSTTLEAKSSYSGISKDSSFPYNIEADNLSYLDVNSSSSSPLVTDDTKEKNCLPRNIAPPTEVPGLPDPLISGFLHRKSNSGLRVKWSRKYFSLERTSLPHHEDDYYQLVYRDKPGLGIDGRIGPIRIGVSKVFVLRNKYSKHKYVFALNLLEYYDRDDMTFYGATNSEVELERWISALTIATTGLFGIDFNDGNFTRRSSRIQL